MMVRTPLSRHWSAWLWPMAISLSAVLVLALLRVHSPVRPIVAVWFLAVCPGMAWARVIGFADVALRWTVAIAASLAVELLLALGMVYAGAWSVTAAVAVLAFVAIAGSIVDALRLAMATGGTSAATREGS